MGDVESMAKVVILLSGGLDSTTCLALAKNKGLVCYALSFAFGQRHSAELVMAKKIAEYYQVKEHIIFPVALDLFGASALTDTNIAVPDYIDDSAIPITYVPARNTVFLSIALAWAETLGAESIYIGASCVDYSHYPDCRPEYFAAFQHLAEIATKVGIEQNHSIKIETPLLHLSKAQTIQLGKKLGVDYAMTVSCYRLDQQGYACGRCDSCTFRKKGFAEAGVLDPTQYRE